MNNRQKRRIRIHKILRKKIVGTESRPRLAVFRSLKHIYAQIIDDLNGKTVVSSSTLLPEIRDKVKKINKKEAAFLVGEVLAEKALAANIESVEFDRGGYSYHGRVKALADAARKKGLHF